MHWAVAVVALTLLAFAAISGRIAGTPITAAMVFTAVGLLVGSEALGLIERRAGRETVKLLAEATLALVLVRGRLADRRARATRRALGAAASARDRPTPDPPGRIRRRPRRVSPALVVRGAAPRGDPRADGRGARSGGRDADEAPEPSATGPERRERSQRRDLRAVVLDRARDRAGRVGSHRRQGCGSAGARADRLRHPGRSGCGHRRRVRRRGRRRAPARRWLLAPGRASGRRRPRLRNRRSDRRLRLHRRVRRRLRVRRHPAAAAAARSGI